MLRGRFFVRFLEPAMNKLLVVALVTACAVNVVCLFGHL
jgi:hypothetical protein